MSNGNQERTVDIEDVLFSYYGPDSQFQVVIRTNDSYAIREVTSEGVECFFLYLGNNEAVVKRFITWMNRIGSN